MTKNQTIFILGFWIILLSFLGIPGNFKTTLFILTGLAISALSFAQMKALKEGYWSTDSESKEVKDQEIYKEDSFRSGDDIEEN